MHTPRFFDAAVDRPGIRRDSASDHAALWSGRPPRGHRLALRPRSTGVVGPDHELPQVGQLRAQKIELVEITLGFGEIELRRGDLPVLRLDDQRLSATGFRRVAYFGQAAPLIDQEFDQAPEFLLRGSARGGNRRPQSCGRPVQCGKVPRRAWTISRALGRRASDELTGKAGRQAGGDRQGCFFTSWNRPGSRTSAARPPLGRLNKSHRHAGASPSPDESGDPHLANRHGE